MNLLEYIIWDFDGVLCDSLEIAFKTHNEICAKYNKEIIVRDKMQYMNLVNSKQGLSTLLDKEELEQYFSKHRNGMYKRRYELKMFNDTMKIIQETTVPSIIITATYEKLVKDVLTNNSYKCKIFKYIVGREMGATKTERLKYLSKKINIDKDKIVYIGDSLTDVEFCNNQNIKMIAVSYGYCPKNLLVNQKIEAICDTPQELKKLLYCSKQI